MEQRRKEKEFKKIDDTESIEDYIINSQLKNKQEKNKQTRRRITYKNNFKHIETF